MLTQFIRKKHKKNTKKHNIEYDVIFKILLNDTARFIVRLYYKITFIKNSIFKIKLCKIFTFWTLLSMSIFIFCKNFLEIF